MPTLTGSAITQASGDPIAVAFPAEAVAGERLVLVIGSNYRIDATPPTGWTMADRGGTGSWFGGAVLTKIADAADITAGSVSVGFEGSEPVTAIALSFSDADDPLTIAFTETTPSPGDATSSASVNVPSNGVGVYAAFARNSTIPGVDRGTTVESTATAPSARLNIEAGPASGTVNFSSASSAGTYYVALYVVGAAAPSTGLILAETLPAIVETFTFRTYIRSDTSNKVNGIRLSGYTIHADNTDPVELPDDGAEQYDVAIAYPPPNLVDGRPT